MTNRPILEIIIPWKFNRIAKSVQVESKSNPRIKVGGNRQGMRVKATVQDYIRMGLARESTDISDPIVGRLRNINVPVVASRTVRLPGGVRVVEFRTGVDSIMAKKLASKIIEQSPVDLVTIYDRGQAGHTAYREGGLVGKGAGVVGMAPGEGQGGFREGNRRVKATKEKYNTLITALRDAWEKNGDDMAQLIDWDHSDYESPDVQDLMAGVMDQYLTPDQVDEWNSLEREVQTQILQRAFPRHVIKSTMENLERHYDNQTRGASVNKPRTLEDCPDPMDLGLRDPENLVRVNQRGSINELFS